MGDLVFHLLSTDCFVFVWRDLAFLNNEDELLLAAVWLECAMNDKTYLDSNGGAGNSVSARSSFSWDDKCLGAQVLASKIILEGKSEGSGIWRQYKS
ncbi:hypothetical protein Ddye_018403 [Dipteronia dyeriana]|uniref:cellulase n=1 Tax=Dipteronia dyeriana TaxID=168575 RepID=A0AAD9UBB6_9ROSI|nr:hypothetical protein Ddye_018403 [Dipteronia dyeriana]